MFWKVGTCVTYFYKLRVMLQIELWMFGWNTYASAVVDYQRALGIHERVKETV
jgi:hypothetical protein